jgi:hypothetical protein
MIGQASEVMPLWIQWAAAAVVLLLSVKPLYRLLISVAGRLSSAKKSRHRSSASTADPESEARMTPDPPRCGPT